MHLLFVVHFLSILYRILKGLITGDRDIISEHTS